MELIYKNAMAALNREEWPELKEKLCPEIVPSLNAYVSAYTEDKNAIEAHDAFEYQYPNTNDMTILRARWAEDGLLRDVCTQTRRRRKMAWRKLMDMLEQDWEPTSTDEEDELD
jgi:hypothetical protein